MTSWVFVIWEQGHLQTQGVIPHGWDLEPAATRAPFFQREGLPPGLAILGGRWFLRTFPGSGSPVSRQLVFPAYSCGPLAPHTTLAGTKWFRYSP